MEEGQKFGGVVSIPTGISWGFKSYHQVCQGGKSSRTTEIRRGGDCLASVNGP